MKGNISFIRVRRCLISALAVDGSVASCVDCSKIQNVSTANCYVLHTVLSYITLSEVSVSQTLTVLMRMVSIFLSSLEAKSVWIKKIHIK